MLGNKPLLVLTAGPLPSGVITSGGFSLEQARQMDELHSESQAELTQRSQNAKQIIAEDSGHYIHVDQPDLVIDAIRQVVEAARNGSEI
jgi:pimeloyl-ACP methyl ester carboxylesterase